MNELILKTLNRYQWKYKQVEDKYHLNFKFDNVSILIEVSIYKGNILIIAVQKLNYSFISPIEVFFGLNTMNQQLLKGNSFYTDGMIYYKLLIKYNPTTMGNCLGREIKFALNTSIKINDYIRDVKLNRNKKDIN